MNERIKQVRTHQIALTIDRGVDLKFWSSTGFRRISHLVVVELETDRGEVGIGEVTPAPRWSGETQSTAAAVIREIFTPLLIDKSVYELSAIMAKIDNSIIGFPYTKAAIEMGLLDLMGKRLGVPVYALIGGPVRTLEVPVRFPIVPLEPERAAELARDVVSRGCSMLKLKVGRGSLADDISRISAVREAVGPEVRLTVDANGHWTVPQAIRASNALAKEGAILVEQPVERSDIAGMAEVRSKIGIPVMADESVFTVRETVRVIYERAADVISLSPGKNGGIRRSMAISEVARSFGVSCTVGSNMEGQIASSAMGHLAVSSPASGVHSWHTDLIGPLFHSESVVKNVLQASANVVRIPDQPGLGVLLDKERLKCACAREQAMRGQ